MQPATRYQLPRHNIWLRLAPPYRCLREIDATAAGWDSSDPCQHRIILTCHSSGVRQTEGHLSLPASKALQRVWLCQVDWQLLPAFAGGAA